MSQNKKKLNSGLIFACDTLKRPQTPKNRHRFIPRNRPRGVNFSKYYDKRDDFNFPIVYLMYLCGNIPAFLTYGDYVS